MGPLFCITAPLCGESTGFPITKGQLFSDLMSLCCEPKTFGQVVGLSVICGAVTLIWRHLNCVERNIQEPLQHHTCGPFYLHGLTWMALWISNHMPSKVWWWNFLSIPFFRYVKLTNQISFKTKFPKCEPTYRIQMVNPRHQHYKDS